MIIKLLATALISLLTISPSIQNNNIEHLIVPNIDIQVNFLDINHDWTWENGNQVNWNNLSWFSYN